MYHLSRYGTQHAMLVRYIHDWFLALSSILKWKMVPAWLLLVMA